MNADNCVIAQDCECNRLYQIESLQRQLAAARDCISALRSIVVDCTEDLRSVLCDPSDICCIDGSDEDRAIVNRTLIKLHDSVISLDRGVCIKQEVQHEQKA